MPSPRVSICIPTYNAAGTLAETLHSVCRQTWRDLEILVVDNASTDATVAIAEAIGDPRINIRQHAENIGAEGNFTRCIELASGEYTAIFHSDDVYEPEIVARQVDWLERHPQAAAVFTCASKIDAQGQVFGAIDAPLAKLDLADDGTLSFVAALRGVLRYSNFFVCPSAMLRTAVYKQVVGRYRFDLCRSSADLDAWLRVLRHAPVGILPDRLIRYRISDQQGSYSLVRRRTMRADILATLDVWVNDPAVRPVLDAADFRNLEWLEYTNRTLRAMNLFLLGQLDEARQVLGAPREWLQHLLQMNDARRVQTMVLAAFIRMMLVTRLHRVGCRLLAPVLARLHR